MEEINIIEAVEYLKNHYIVATIDKNKVYFKYSKNKIRVINGNASYVLNLKDFLSYYEKNIFYVVEDNAFEVSKEKDDEYYSFKHK